MFSRIVAKRTVAALASSTPSSTSKVLAINEFTKRWMADAYFIHPQEVTDRVVAVIQRFDKIVDKDKVTGTSHFNKDLGLDRYVSQSLIYIQTYMLYTSISFNWLGLSLS